MSFKISVDKGRSPFTHFWNGTGFSPGSLLLNADMKQQMAYAGSIPFNGIRYIRIHFLLDLVKIDTVETDNPLYHWDILDQCIDVLINKNLVPFFELMGNPEEYFTDFTDDSQIRKWKEFVYNLALHFIDRYGKESVLQWYFETWNEPDQIWWTQSEEAFCNYYDACSEGLYKACPDLRFGGSGTCVGISSMYKAFLAHCDTGINYFTKEKGVRLDFISIHEKGAQACVEDINPNSQEIIVREKRLYDYIIENHPRFSNTPFINNECDPQVGWWDTHSWRGKAYHAAIAVKIIAQHLESFKEKGVNYALLSNDNRFVGSWGRRTLMTRFGLEEDKMAQFEYKISDDEFSENPERRKFAMVKKPVLSVMTMLSFLGDEHCPVKSNSSSKGKDLGVIATVRNNNQVAVIIYHSNDKIMSSGNEMVHLELTGIPFTRGILTEYRIEEGYTDPFSIWEANGYPQIPDVSLLEKMRDEAELTAIDSGREINILNGELEIKTTVPLPSIRLFLITDKTDSLPGQVGQPHAEIYSGLDIEFEDVLLEWPGINSYNLNTYEVLYRRDKGLKFNRINRTDTVCSLWLHTRKKGDTGEYQVRAVDFWKQVGKESESVFI